MPASSNLSIRQAIDLSIGTYRRLGPPRPLRSTDPNFTGVTHTPPQKAAPQLGSLLALLAPPTLRLDTQPTSNLRSLIQLVVLNLYQVHPTSNDYSALQIFAFLTDKAHRAPPKTKRSYFLCANHLAPVIEVISRSLSHSTYTLPTPQAVHLFPARSHFGVLPYLEAHLSLTSPTAANQLFCITLVR